MKTNKLVNILLTAPIALTSITPLMAITACSEESVYAELERTTIKEFAQLCKIPHSSDKFLHKVPYESNVMELSNYIKNKVKWLTPYEVHQDKFGNIWFDVPYNDDSLKDVPTIAMQAHMDMVFTYDSNQYKEAPDPLKTSIELVLERNKEGKRIIHSKDYKTTIGADNGIGVAAILALLQCGGVKHGNLRIIFTNCEENAMQGAMLMVKGYTDPEGKYTTPATAPAILHNIKYVLNMDGGLGNTISEGCSGASGGYYQQVFSQANPTLQNKFEIKISGFDGGHSGGAVRQYKGNAIKAANETLINLGQFELASVATPGTTVYNRVPSDCTITFTTSRSEADIKQAFEKVIASHKCEEGKEPGLWKDADKAKIQISSNIAIDKVISYEDSLKIVTLQNTLPYCRDEVEEAKGIKTSANIGPANLFVYNNNQFKYTLETYSRSDSAERVKKYEDDNGTAASTGGFDFIPTSFPSWKAETNKKLFNLVGNSLKEVLKFSEIKTTSGHGGVEPAAWSYAMRVNEGIEDGNCVCMGINVANEHEATETIDVESIQPCFKVVTKILKNAASLK